MGLSSWGWGGPRCPQDLLEAQRIPKLNARLSQEVPVGEERSDFPRALRRKWQSEQLASLTHPKAKGSM